MDVTRRQATNIEAGKKVGFGPMNGFSHMSAFPTEISKPLCGLTSTLYIHQDGSI